MRTIWTWIKVIVWWPFHVDAKFTHYKQMWDRHYDRWQDAHLRDDGDAMLNHLEQQALYLQAEKLAHADMRLPLRQRASRWDADYITEAQAALSISPDRAKRMCAIETIMRQARRSRR